MSPSFLEKAFDPDGARQRAELEQKRRDVEALEQRAKLARRRREAERDLAPDDEGASAIGTSAHGPSPERVDRYARKAVELREPDGTWPTQQALAEALQVTDRSVRDVGWDQIIERATELGGSAGSSG